MSVFFRSYPDSIHNNPQQDMKTRVYRSSIFAIHAASQAKMSRFSNLSFGLWTEEPCRILTKLLAGELSCVTFHTNDQSPCRATINLIFSDESAWLHRCFWTKIFSHWNSQCTPKKLYEHCNQVSQQTHQIIPSVSPLLPPSLGSETSDDGDLDKLSILNSDFFANLQCWNKTQQQRQWNDYWQLIISAAICDLLCLCLM